MDQALYTEIESDDSDIPLSVLATCRAKLPYFTEIESDVNSPNKQGVSRWRKVESNCNTQLPYFTEIESDVNSPVKPALSRWTDARCRNIESKTHPKKSETWLTEIESNELHEDSGEEETTETLCFTEIDSGNDASINFTLHLSSDESDKENSVALAHQNRPMNKSTRAHKKVRFGDMAYEDDDESADAEDYTVTARKGTSRITPVATILTRRCCSQHCVRRVDIGAATSARSAFSTRSGQAQRQWLLSYFFDHHQKKDGLTEYVYLVGTQRVCSTAWRNLHGITKTRFYQLKKIFEGGSRKLPSQGFLRRGEVTMKTAHSLAWLERYAGKCGDKLPDSNKIHLPSCLTKGDVFNIMKTELEDIGEKGCKESVFYRHWRRDLQHIAIPKENRFAKCDKCTLLRTSIQKTLDKVKRREFYEKRDNHLRHQNNERKKYYKHIQKAKSSPQQYMSIIIDGMDQKSTSLPSFLVIPKSLCSMWRLPTHITGVIVHGRGHHAFIDFKEVPHDSNLTINVLLQTLLKYPSLPPTLYLQLDNCGRENKNKFVFAICCLLVELEIFKKIKVSFLMVGHTHEDIDQMFSRFSTFISRHKVHTFSLLLDLLPKAFQKPNVTAQRITHLLNFRDWIEPNLNPVAEHSKPHVFKFTRDETGKAVMHTKGWGSTGESWLPCTSSADIEPYLLLKHPPEDPKPTELDFSPLQLHKLQRDLIKARPFFEESERKEWQDLLSCFAKENQSRNTERVVQSPIAQILGSKIAAEGTSTGTALAQPEDDFTSDDCMQPPQVRLGKKPSSKKSSKLEVGKMVATYLEQYSNEWPQVGEVTNITEDAVHLNWYSGTYSSSWHALNIHDNGKTQVWRAEVKKADIIGEPFDLTKSCKLPCDVVRILKSKFEVIYT